jgi:hypothetical protein
VDCVQGLLAVFSYLMALLNFPRTLQKAWQEPSVLNTFVIIVYALFLALPVVVFFVSLSSHR